MHTSFDFDSGSTPKLSPSHKFSRHPEEPRACAASRRTAKGACGPSFEARRERRAPQDDGGVYLAISKAGGRCVHALAPARGRHRVCRHLAKISVSNFKQPSLCILAAQSVRGLPVPREVREGMERWEAPGHQRAPLEAGLTYPPRAARHRARPRQGAAPPSAPPATRPSTVPGRPGPASFRSVR
jgi:hypothetical protein